MTADCKSTFAVGRTNHTDQPISYDSVIAPNNMTPRNLANGITAITRHVRFKNMGTLR